MTLTLASLAVLACLQQPTDLPAISIIIDDLGNRPQHDYAALETPGLLSFAILPFAPLTAALARTAHENGKEIFLHLPMEAESKNHLLGPGALQSTMAYDEYTSAIRLAIADVPNLVGVNNHMGSLLTKNAERMRWLMQVLSRESGLVYVDSRTTARSAAGQAAREAAVTYLARDVFLDNKREPEYIQARFDELVRRALERGNAIGIAHPHPETLAVLRMRLPELKHVRLTSIMALVQQRECHAAQSAASSAGISATAQGEQSRTDTERAE